MNTLLTFHAYFTRWNKLTLILVLISFMLFNVHRTIAASFDANTPVTTQLAADQPSTSHDDTPALDVNGAASFLAGDNPVILSSDLTLTGPANGILAAATVSIGSGLVDTEDLLGIDGQVGSNGTVNGIAWVYDSSSGILNFSGTASFADYQQALRQVTYANSSGTPTIQDRAITFSIGEGLYFERNGHYYEFVEAANIFWTDALPAAEARSYYGLQGYLATVTSAEENGFIDVKLQGNGWFGATDDPAYTPEPDNGPDKEWYWASGPEKDTHFFTQNSDGNDCGQGPAATQPTDASGNPYYTNWDTAAGTEPNDGSLSQPAGCSNNEDYAHYFFQHPFNNAANRKWNDYPNDPVAAFGASFAIAGYIVEYGGMPGDPALSLNGRVTVAVLDNNSQPRLVDHDPENNEIGVALDKSIDLFFSHPIDSGSVSTQTVTAHGSLSGLLSGSFTVNGSDVTFDPSNNYFAGERVQVSVSSGVEANSTAVISDSFAFTAGPIIDHCVGVFTDTGATLENMGGNAAWADYDGDGDLDPIINGYNGGARVTRLYNNNNGSFSLVTTGLPGIDHGGIEWGDYDNDGDPDLLLIGWTGSGSVGDVYRNDGGGTFTPINVGMAAGSSAAVAWGDYDNDGDLDFVYGANQSGRVGDVYRNDGNDTFTALNAGISPTSQGDAAWGDYDNDGDLDFLMAGYLAQGAGTLLYRNNGDDTFTQVANLPAASAVDWGDYNGDGLLDIATMGLSNNHTNSDIFRNNGDDTFTALNTSLVGDYTGGVAWGDFDNDGDLDLGFGGAGGDSALGVLVNDNGTFTEASFGTYNFWVSSVDWGDYDGDGDLDMLTTAGSSGGYDTALWRNDDCQITAVDDHATLYSEVPTTLDVTANDTVVSPVPAQISAVGTPSNGTAVINGTQVVYTANPSFIGTDTFTYTAGWTNASDTATVTVNVIEDPGSCYVQAGAIEQLSHSSSFTPSSGYRAMGQSFTVPEGVSYTEGVTAYFSFIEADSTLTLEIYEGAASGTVGTPIASATYTNSGARIDAPDATGLAIPFEFSNPLGLTPNGDYYFLISSTIASSGYGVVYNWSNLYSGGVMIYKTTSDTVVTYSNNYDLKFSVYQKLACSIDAVDDNLATYVDQAAPLDVLANDAVVGPITPTLSIDSPPTNGTASVNGSQIVYTPTTGFDGSDSFIYGATIGSSVDTATVTVNVIDLSGCVAQGGVIEQLSSNTTLAYDNSSYRQWGQSFTISAGVSYIEGVTAYLSHIEAGATLTLNLYEGAATGPIGTPIATSTYTNSGDRVEDAGNEGLPISFGFDSPLGVTPGETYSFLISPAFNPSQFGVVATTANDYADGTMLYVNSSNQVAIISSSYDLKFAVYQSTSCEIDAIDDVTMAYSNKPLTIDVMANDIITGTSTPTITSIGDPSSGTTTISGTQVIYQSAASYAGTDTFTYTAALGDSADTATVSVNVIPGGDSCQSKIGQIEQLLANSAVQAANPVYESHGQSFTVPNGVTYIEGITAYLSYVRANTTISLNLYQGPDSGTIGTPIASATFDNPGAQISGGANGYATHFRFDHPVMLTPGEQYYFLMPLDYTGGTNFGAVVTNYSSYAGGAMLFGFSGNQVDPWQSSSYDLKFSLFTCDPTVAPDRIFLSKTVGINGTCTASNIDVAAGTQVTYCYQVTNQSAVTLTQHTLVDDQLGTLFTDLNYELGIGASYRYTTTATINSDTTNVATWTAEDANDNTVADTAQAVVTVTKTDLEIRKWTYAPSVVAGDELTYYITYRNRTHIAAQNVVIEDVLPAELSYVSTQTNWQSGNHTIQLQGTGDVVSWTIPTLPAYASGSILLRVAVDNGATAGTLTNEATITSSTPDTNALNDSAQASVQVTESFIDLSIDKWVYGWAQPGGTLYYYVYYRNNGNRPVDNVTITDTLPSELSYLSHNNYYHNATLEVDGNELVWSVGQMGAYQVGYIYLTVQITDTVPATTDLVNNITINGDGTDTDTANNSDSVTVTVNVPGSISGTVKLDNDSPVRFGSVQAIQREAPFGSGWTSVDADGNYQIDNLPAGGEYEVYFYTSEGSQVYDGKTTIADATRISVVSGQTTPNINAVFAAPPPPRAAISSGNNVHVDPSTGISTLWINPYNPSDVTFSKEITCEGGVTPSGVTLVYETQSNGTFEYQMTADGSTYSATVPAADLSRGTFSISYDCGSTTVDEVVGHGLIDPSGYITDAVTGDPIVGATVQLFTIDDWTPKVGPSDTSPNTCHTLDSRPSEWNEMPPAPQIGRLGNPLAAPQEIDPVQNPLLTNDVGHYAWDVAAGCWYIVVTADGYITRVSPVVGVPPEVTDLDLTMQPIGVPTSVNLVNGNATNHTLIVSVVMLFALLMTTLFIHKATRREQNAT